MDPASKAIALHDAGKFPTLRQAALALKVPLSTASRRKSGILPRGQNTNPHARLTLVQERVLVA
jgi:hypothetical protein